MARYSDSASPDEAVLVETDDFALVYDRQNRAFRKKLWNSSTKSWTTKVAPYSALVAKDGSTVWAEDATGKTIASGESGVDDASVIQSALDAGGKVFIAASEYLLSSHILIKQSNVHVEGTLSTVLKMISTDNAIRIDTTEKDLINIIIRNLKINGNKNNIPEGSYRDQASLIFCTDSNNKIYNLQIENLNIGYCRHGATIRLRNVVGGFVRSCFIHDSGFESGVTWRCDGIYVGNSNNIIIEGNYIDNNTDVGIALDNNMKVVVGNNIIKDSYRNGLTVVNANDDLQLPENIMIAGNVFENNGRGGLSTIHILTDYTNKPQRINIAGNLIKKSGAQGIAIKRASHVSIRANSIFLFNNSACIELTDDNFNVNIEENTFTDADWGVKVSGTGNSQLIIRKNKLLAISYHHPTENSGTATFSGNGTTTQFSIAHGLVSAPTKVLVTPMTADAASDFYVTADDTNIYINYKSAPPSGTDNLKFSWYAEV